MQNLSNARYVFIVEYYVFCYTLDNMLSLYVSGLSRCGGMNSRAGLHLE
jgi:hypothetical protein